MKNDVKLFIAAGLLLAVGLALLLSPFASGNPDGLNQVAIEKGFAKSATDHSLDNSPVAGYAVRGVDDDGVGKGLSGLIGVLLTFGVGLASFAALRRLRASQATNPAEGQP